MAYANAQNPHVFNRRYLTAAAFSVLVHVAVLAGLRARAFEAPKLAAPDVLHIQLVAAAPPAVPEKANRVEPPKPNPIRSKRRKPKPLPPSPVKPRVLAQPEAPPPPEQHPAPRAAARTTPTPIQTAAAASPSQIETAKAVEALVEARSDVASLNNPKPLYPLIARRRRLEGEVLLSVKVLRDGLPGEVLVKQSSGYEVLDDAALNAVRRWHFVPARRGSAPVDSWVEVPIRFRLEG
jgi:periplasmic protein TonB